MPFPIQIEIDAFSGRTNPRFVIGKDQSLRLAQLLGRNLEPANEAPSMPELGFRGFLVTTPDADVCVVRVLPRWVVKGGRVFKDPENLAFKFLQSITPQEFRSVVRE